MMNTDLTKQNRKPTLCEHQEQIIYVEVLHMLSKNYFFAQLAHFTAFMHILSLYNKNDTDVPNTITIFLGFN